MKKTISIWISALGLCLGCGLIKGTGAGVDTTFGNQGYATVAVSTGEDKVNAMTTDAEGAIYLVGASRAATQDFAIAKLSAEGALDTRFGTDGKTLVDFGSDDEAFAVLPQSEDGLLVVGRSVVGGNAKLAVTRLNANGAVDTSYGTDGKFDSVIGVGAEFRAAGQDVFQRTLVAGSAIILGTRRFVVVRLTSAGALDKTFGDEGVSTYSPGASGDSASSLLVTSNRIYVGGTRTASRGSTNTDFAVLALTPNGAVDSSFGTSGVFSFDFTTVESTTVGSSPTLDAVHAMTMDSVGRILLAGESIGTTGGRLAAVRLSAAGALDTSFGVSSVFLGQFKEGTQTLDGRVHSVIANSGYLLTGTADNPKGTLTQTEARTYIALTTLNENGQVSGSDLVATGSYAEARTSALGANGKWLIGGSVFNGTDWDFLALRYLR